MIGEQCAQAQREVDLLQLAGANIDADRQVQSFVLPAFDLRQCRIDHPFADIDSKRMILDHR